MLLLLWRTRVADWLTNQSTLHWLLRLSLPRVRLAVAARRPVKRDGTLNCKRFDRYIYTTTTIIIICTVYIISCFTRADCVWAASVVKSIGITQKFILLSQTPVVDDVGYVYYAQTYIILLKETKKKKQKTADRCT